MVNILLGKELPAKEQLHNIPMFKDAPAIYRDNSIPLLVQIIPEGITTPILKPIEIVMGTQPHTMSIAHKMLVPASPASVNRAEIGLGTGALVAIKRLAPPQCGSMRAADTPALDGSIVTPNYFTNLVHNVSSIPQRR